VIQSSLLQQYAINWTLLDPSDGRVALLDHLPGWRRVFNDNIAVVHVRVENWTERHPAGLIIRSKEPGDGSSSTQSLGIRGS
jgi:hypothetical protein